MTSYTNTSFKQKTCPKCKNNHDNEGVLCSFCIQRHNAALAKVTTPPDNFWVKCLIDREGDTTLNLGNIQYLFKRNLAGDAVCEIINLGHYNQIIKSDFYEAYVPKEPEPVKIAEAAPEGFYFTDGELELIDHMLIVPGKFTHTEIAAKVTESFGRPISRQRITRYHQG